MPSYTITFMRQDVTDKRPLRIHISTGLFWTLLVLLISLPFLGFAISAGLLAPAWVKLDFEGMQKSVEHAQQVVAPLKQQNVSLAKDKQTLTGQLKTTSGQLAEAEAKATMAETAQAAASKRLQELEGETIDLKKSLAVYDQLLKPKLSKEMVQCVDQQVDYANGKVTYDLSFSKVSGQTNLPAGLKVQLNVLAGNNAVAMQQTASSAATTTQAFDLAKSQHIKGVFTVNLPSDTTHLIDAKVLDGNTPVGYCWKAF